MALTDIAERDPSAPSKGPQCTVCKLLLRLPDSEAAALRKLLADPSWRFSELSDALYEEHIDIPQGTLARHARGGCSAREKMR